MAFKDFFRSERDHDYRGDRDHDDERFRDRLRSMRDEWRGDRGDEWRERERGYERDRGGYELGRRERGGGYGAQREWPPGSEFGEDRQRSYGSSSGGEDMSRSGYGYGENRDEGRRDYAQRYGQGGSRWGGEDRSYGGGYGGRESDQGVYSRYYGGGGSGYGGSGYAGSYSRGAGSSWGEGGYGRDLDSGRRGALGYGGYGGVGGAETGSNARSWGGAGEEQQTQSTQHRGKGPKNYRRSDERIREEICDCLTDDPHVDASNIEVTVKDGDVTIAGSVNSRAEKRHAEDLIDRLSGVKDVTNNLRVMSAEGAQPSSSENMASPSARH